jgi:D-alanine-D-alanine ligase
VKINVAVLMGGRSAEREISLSTGRMILDALDRDKYDVVPIDTANLGGGSAVDAFAGMSCLDCGDGSFRRPDVAIIALHGKFGEDGTIQGLLELLGIPYVGSGVLSSALAMDKIMARKVMQYEGILVPAGIAVDRTVDAGSLAAAIEEDIGFPVVVKPNREGSTIGLSIVRSAEELSAALDLAFASDRDVLVEEFIEGTEITVPVLGNDDLQALPIVEIVPAGGFYDYYSKYTPGATDEIVPARIPENLAEKAVELALACHKALRCRGMSRTDMIVCGDEVYVLETNTIPGMTPTSLLPRAAQAAGIEFPELLDRLIALALERGSDL